MKSSFQTPGCSWRVSTLVRQARLQLLVAVGFAFGFFPGGASAERIFSNDIPVLSFSLSSDSLQALAIQGTNFVSADLVFGTQRQFKLGLRQLDSNQVLTAGSKPSLVVRVDVFGSNQPVAGMREFELRNGKYDGGYLAGFSVSELAAAMGVPHPRTDHARVMLNGRELGIYIVNEIPGAEWLDQNFGQHDGILYRGDNGDVTEPLRLLCQGDDKFKSRILSDLLRATYEPDFKLRREQLSERLDLEAFYKFMAFEAILGSATGYTEVIANYYLYLNPETERAEFIPGPARYAFTATDYPLLTQKRGRVSQGLMKTSGAWEGFMAAVASVATNRTIETNLLQAVARRSQAIQNASELPRAKVLTQTSEEILTGRIQARLADVRRQVNEEVNNKRPRQERISLLTTSDHDNGGRLGFRGPIDYGARFRTLMRSTNDLPVDVKVHELAITAPAGMLENLPVLSTDWVSVNMTGDGAAYTEVGLRLKGHGSRQSFRSKPSFTLKFNRQNVEQRFEANTKVHLHNARYDKSFLNELLGTWAFEKAGLPVPKTEFAHVVINGRDAGVFVLSQGVTRKFLKHAFHAEDGLLFEGEQTDVNGPLELDSGRRPVPYADLLNFANAAQAARSSGQLGNLGQYCLVDEFARFTAVEMIIGHTDGYAYSHSNYRLYQTAVGQPFHFIAHGMDYLDLQSPNSIFPKFKGLVASALVNSAEGKVVYSKQLEDVLKQKLDLDEFTAYAAAVCRKLQPFLRRSEPLLAPQQLAAAESLVRQLGDRKAYLLHELDLQHRYGLLAEARSVQKP